ncbi:MAG: DUF4446 family protein [bacterium]|nr:DUF4446 family protein [bacterium]
MNSINFTDPLFIGIIILSIVSIVLLVMVIRTNAKLKKFLIPLDAVNIEESLTQVATNLKELQQYKDEMNAYLSSVEKRLKKSVQSVHTVRFNPFKGTGGGGNQSFATTLLNEEGDGVIISSLYSREHVSVFSKPVVKHKAEHELSEEEKESLDNAISELVR